MAVMVDSCANHNNQVKKQKGLLELEVHSIIRNSMLDPGNMRPPPLQGRALHGEPGGREVGGISFFHPILQALTPAIKASISGTDPGMSH
jgi:hypothetical protein